MKGDKKMTIFAMGEKFDIDKGAVRDFGKKEYGKLPSKLTSAEKAELKDKVSSIVKTIGEQIKNAKGQFKSPEIAECELKVKEELLKRCK